MNFWHRIQYGLLLGTCRVLGLLPDWFLYSGLGNTVYFILHRGVRYRLTVVRENLRNSFPEKSPAELAEIERKFYHHLAEIFIDTMKLPSISRREILERMQYRNVEAHEAALRGRSWIAAMSHFGSWELTINYVCHSDHELLAVYRPLHSAAFDRFYQYARSRFGTRPVAMHEILREVVRAHRRENKPAAVAMIADQTPPRGEIKHWYRFLNQDTPFFSGIEKMAPKFGMPVYFTYIRKTAPRHYEAEFQPIYDGREPLTDHEITERYVKKLEAMIRETPELWMWSHRRWKHKKIPAHA